MMVAVQAEDKVHELEHLWGRAPCIFEESDEASLGVVDIGMMVNNFGFDVATL